MMLTVPVWAQSADEKETTESNAVRQDLAGLKYDHSLELQYADQFSVDYYEDGYALITIAGDGQFLLVPEGKEAPEGLDSDIAVIKQPLDNIYLVATSAMDLFCALDGLDSISLSGTNADGWYIDEAKKALEDGSISFAGKYSAPDYELILSKNCDLAIESTMIYHKPEVKEKLEQFGIPVLVEHSSYESHPLGRTEWLKLYGVLLGKEELADKLNVSSNTVAKIECGLRRPSVDFVVDLVNFFDTTVDYIILGEEIKKRKIMKCFFAFSYHNSGHLRHFCQEFFSIVRNLRTACPKSCFWKYLNKITNQFPYKRNIPDIAGEADNVCSTAVNIFQYLILWLVDRILPKDHMLIIIR